MWFFVYKYLKLVKIKLIRIESENFSKNSSTINIITLEEQKHITELENND